MDATELARWFRFAAKGGIGTCTATHDCLGESPEDLMFLKDDAIIVLMQLPEDTRDGEGTSSGWYLGYCEGVVGRFQGKHVHFHSKLKRPVMTKRSSTPPPTPTSSTPDSTPRLPANAASTRPPSFQSSHFSFVSLDTLSSFSLSSLSLLEYEPSLYDDNCSLVPPPSEADDPTTDPCALQSFCSIEHIASSGSVAVGPHQDRVLVIGSHINTITININPTIHGDCLSGPISNAIVGGRNNANHSKRAPAPSSQSGISLASMLESEEPKL